MNLIYFIWGFSLFFYSPIVNGSLTCAYCGVDKFCPVPFDETTVSKIKCEKSCMKFDGYTSDDYRLIVRSCGYFDADECVPNSDYEHGTANGVACQCKSDMCNSAYKLKYNMIIIYFSTITILLNNILLRIM